LKDENKNLRDVAIFPLEYRVLETGLERAVRKIIMLEEQKKILEEELMK
jgi:TPP-dependent indolepyruvate ferredoxin oxidoreductase alpha subunit